MTQNPGEFMEIEEVVKAVFTDTFGIQLIDCDMCYYKVIVMSRSPYTTDYDVLEKTKVLDLGVANDIFTKKLELLRKGEKR